MKVGARNQIVGKVTEIKKGSVMAEVKLEIPAAARMASVMTVESLDDLGLKPGDEVQVVVKAVSLEVTHAHVRVSQLRVTRLVLGRTSPTSLLLNAGKSN